MAIENIILNSAIASVQGLSTKGDEYIQSVQVWVISLTNIRVEPRKNAESAAAGLNSILYKGGYISSQARNGQHSSWPFLWFSGGAKWTAYKSINRVQEMIPGKGMVETVTGESYPLMNLAKNHEGEVVPYNVNIPLTGNLLATLLPEGSKEQKSIQVMAGAMPMLESKMRELAGKHGEVQIHVTIGMSPETWAASSVKKMYKSSADLEDKFAFECQLQDRDILGLKWVVPGDATFVPGLNLGQIVNLNSERVEVEAEKEVLSPDEVLPKDAQVIRYINKNFGKFIKESGLDHSLLETRKKFLGTLTGSYLKWVLIAEKEAKALEVLSNWNPAGKAGPRTMGKTAVPTAEALEKEVATPVAEVPAARASRMGSRLNKGGLASLGQSLAGEFED